MKNNDGYFNLKNIIGKIVDFFNNRFRKQDEFDWYDKEHEKWFSIGECHTKTTPAKEIHID